MNHQSNPGRRTVLPILEWLPHYDRTWLRGDIIAGLTVMALLVPEGMAYPELAGMPPQTAFRGPRRACALRDVRLVAPVGGGGVIGHCGDVGIDCGRTGACEHGGSARSPRHWPCWPASWRLWPDCCAWAASRSFLRIGADRLRVGPGVGHHDQAGAQIVGPGRRPRQLPGNGSSNSSPSCLPPTC
ncbi:MAG: SulP family inorganic anion transporter [Caldilineaceae bacterium]